jgi:hypothetical protein
VEPRQHEERGAGERQVGFDIFILSAVGTVETFRLQGFFHATAINSKNFELMALEIAQYYPSLCTISLTLCLLDIITHTTTPLRFHVLHAKPHSTMATPTLAAQPQAHPVKHDEPMHSVLSGSLPAL